VVGNKTPVGLPWFGGSSEDLMIWKRALAGTVPGSQLDNQPLMMRDAGRRSGTGSEDADT
jgi:hypothetical protein